MIGEVAEMAYLWRTPHAIDGAKLAAALPGFQATPLDEAIADALGANSAEPASHRSMSRLTPGAASNSVERALNAEA